MKIIHIINSLEKGGAEGNLYRLCQFQKKKYKNKYFSYFLSLERTIILRTPHHSVQCELNLYNMQKEYFYYGVVIT
jgi:hypothetical protein